MNNRDKQFLILSTILIFLVIIFYIVYIGDLNSGIKNIKNNIEKTKIKKKRLTDKIERIKKELSKWENTEKDLLILKKEYLFSLNERNVLRFNMEQMLIKSGINPTNEQTSITKIAKGFYTLNIKFNTIPEETMFSLIENIRKTKQLIFIDSLNVRNFPDISSSVVIKGVLTDEK